MFLEISLVLVSVLFVTSCYVIWNITTKLEALEDWVTDFINTVEKIQMEIKKMEVQAQLDQQKMQMQHQFDMQLKQVETQMQAQKENQKEDRKDKRIKMEGTQQSEMISQRQNDGLPINFENQPDAGMSAFM